MVARGRMLQGLAAAMYARGVILLGQVLVVPILVTRWGAAGYGEWVALTALASYLAFTHVGVPGAIRADMAMSYSRDDRAAMRESFQTSFLLVVAVAALVGATFLLAVHFLPVTSFFHAQFMSPAEAAIVASAFAVQVVVYVAAQVLFSALSSIGKYGLATFLDANRQTAEFLSIFVVVGLLRQRPAQASLFYPAITTLYCLGQGLMLWRYAPWLLKGPWRFQPHVFHRLGKPMLGLLGMSFGYYGMSVQAPRIILATTLGPAAVAAYTVTTMLMRVVRIVLDLSGHSATVEMSLAYGRGDMETARRLYGGATSFSLWSAIIILPFVVLFGPTIAHVWSNGRLTVPPMLILLSGISTALFSLALPAQEGLMSVGRLGRATAWMSAAALPFVLVAIVLARRWGLVGVGFAVVLIDAAYAGTSVFWVLKSFAYPTRDFLRRVMAPPTDIIRSELATIYLALAKRRQAP